MTLTLLHSKMFDVGNLPVLTSVIVYKRPEWLSGFWNCTYDFYVIYVFFQNPKNMTFYVFWVVAHVISNAGGDCGKLVTWAYIARSFHISGFQWLIALLPGVLIRIVI